MPARGQYKKGTASWIEPDAMKIARLEKELEYEKMKQALAPAMAKWGEYLILSIVFNRTYEDWSYHEKQAFNAAFEDAPMLREWYLNNLIENLVAAIKPNN